MKTVGKEEFDKMLDLMTSAGVAVWLERSRTDVVASPREHVEAMMMAALEAVALERLYEDTEA